MEDLILSNDELDTETVNESACPAAPCSPSLDLRLADCVDVMREAPDNHWNLAIVDPPYGIERFQKKGSIMSNAFDLAKWDKRPNSEYWAELMRVSENQIVWGGNYFGLPPTKHFVFWHKLDAAPSFAKGEMAWSSFDRPAAYWSSAIEKSKCHPCQKPIKLYAWLLDQYAKPGQRILDTHMGSGSIAIACHYFGAHLTACEIDEEYYNTACERIERETRQMELPLFS